MAATNEKELSRVDRFLNTIERVCNKLPPPAILFCILFLIVAFVGMFFTFSGFGLENPATHKVVYSQNLFTKEGVQWLLTSMVKNFTGFAPLGLVITMTMAIGFCEESGMLVAMLRRSMKNVPPNIVPFLIAFLGTVGNIASDTAMVVIPPLAALVYIGVKKNPVVGMIVGYAGAQAGFTANLMIAGTDSLLQGLTNQAIDAFLGTPGKFVVDVTCNWYFMIASTFLCSLVIGLVSTRIVEPRFPVYHSKDEDETIQEVTPLEVKGLHRAGFAVVLYIAILAIGFFAGVLSKDGHTLVGSLLLKGLIPILFFLFSIAGITYGITTGSFKSVKDVNKAMVKQMSGMGAYVVFCFFCGQFQLFSTGPIWARSWRFPVLTSSEESALRAFPCASPLSSLRPSSTSLFRAAQPSGPSSLRSSFRCSCSLATILDLPSSSIAWATLRGTALPRCLPTFG